MAPKIDTEEGIFRCFSRFVIHNIESAETCHIVHCRPQKKLLEGRKKAKVHMSNSCVNHSVIDQKPTQRKAFSDFSHGLQIIGFIQILGYIIVSIHPANNPDRKVITVKSGGPITF